MRKMISFMYISLDGYISGPKGELDRVKVDEEIFDYVGKRISKTNTALNGQVTYQMMDNYWPDAGDKPSATTPDKEQSKWYIQEHKIVLSKTMEEVDLKNTKIISDNLLDSIQELKRATPSPGGSGNELILLLGSPTPKHTLIQLN